MKRTLLRSPAFARDVRRWIKARPASAADLEAALNRLADDGADPALRSHKLRGRLEGCRACSAGYDLRIVYELVRHDGEEAILLLALGTHDEVY